MMRCLRFDDKNVSLAMTISFRPITGIWKIYVAQCRPNYVSVTNVVNEEQFGVKLVMVYDRGII